MLQIKLKVISILLLIVLALFSLTLSAGSIVIRGKGIVKVDWEFETGSYIWRCDNSSIEDCFINIHYPTP